MTRPSGFNAVAGAEEAATAAAVVVVAVAAAVVVAEASRAAAGGIRQPSAIPRAAAEVAAVAWVAEEVIIPRLEADVSAVRTHPLGVVADTHRAAVAAWEDLILRRAAASTSGYPTRLGAGSSRLAVECILPAVD